MQGGVLFVLVIDRVYRDVQNLVGGCHVEEQVLWRPCVVQCGGGARDGFAESRSSLRDGGGCRYGGSNGKRLETGKHADAEDEVGAVVGGPPGDEAGEASQ